jgi:hypothetical protein
MICSSENLLRFIRPSPRETDSTQKWRQFRGARQGECAFYQNMNKKTALYQYCNGKRVRPQALSHRQRTELRNKLSLPAVVSGHVFLKNFEFASFFGGMAIHCSLATYGPLVGKTARLPRASRTLSPVPQPKALENGHFHRLNPCFRGSVDMMFSLSATTYATGVVRIKNGRQR